MSTTTTQAPTTAQLRVLRDLAAGKDAWVEAPHFRRCLDHGWIERCDTTQVLSKNPPVSFTTFRCRLTTAGRDLLRSIDGYSLRR